MPVLDKSGKMQPCKATIPMDLIFDKPYDFSPSKPHKPPFKIRTLLSCSTQPKMTACIIHQKMPLGCHCNISSLRPTTGLTLLTTNLFEWSLPSDNCPTPSSKISSPKAIINIITR
ncbi:uncharacterized protein N7479_005207 [Penicillium vulpinum]|uniref:uncharacterized protein n=1 Tax=Penicillium vulpinum TaxID=29845 RepID=UPI002549694B|nr:uncharacterized protein N7479_005207 [Penicillium vulpinum]KAJ5958057.1 hypothetical protein N7479_005207 [Penicillium vulpinum]